MNLCLITSCTYYIVEWVMNDRVFRPRQISNVYCYLTATSAPLRHAPYPSTSLHSEIQPVYTTSRSLSLWPTLNTTVRCEYSSSLKHIQRTHQSPSPIKRNQNHTDSYPTPPHLTNQPPSQQPGTSSAASTPETQNKTCKPSPASSQI